MDRIYSLWQVLHPGVEVEPQIALDPTIMYKEGIIQDKTTPLYPFRHPDGTYFTSNDVDKWDSTLCYGYRYPETPAELFKVEEQASLKRHVSERVIDILGPDYKSFPLVPKKAIEEVNKVSEVANSVKRTCKPVRKAHETIANNHPRGHFIY